MMIFMKAHKIYETLAFKRVGDPYNKLSIGSKAKIENWFKQWLPNIRFVYVNSEAVEAN